MGKRHAVHDRDEVVNAEFHYSLGREVESGRPYLSIPVTIAVADYEEYYELFEDEYKSFASDVASANDVASRCRAHAEDGRLMQQPGWNRGTPT